MPPFADTELSRKSPVAYHCLTHVLNDPQDASFSSQCTHMHDMVCTACSTLHHVLQEIEMTLPTISQENIDDIIYVAQQSSAAILAMKSHLLSSVQPGPAKTYNFGELGCWNSSSHT